MSDFRETAYPLQWPETRPRTSAHQRQWARFKVTLGTARDELFEELRRLGARRIVLSTNLHLRRDGLPHANQRTPDDPGAAVYFEYDGARVAFACDRWTRTEHNIWAIHHTIDALRAIARWGTGDMVKAAFRGFVALPAPAITEPPWYHVLGVDEDANRADIVSAYRILAKKYHPDAGGSDEQMAQLNRAYEKALRAVGVVA